MMVRPCCVSVLIAGLSIYSSVSMAQAVCGSSSPLVQEGKEVHEPLTPKPVTEGQYRRLEGFIKSIQGRYKGSWKDLVCAEPENGAHQVRTASTVAEIERSSTAALNVQLDIKGDGYSTVESLVYALDKVVLMSSASDGTVNTVLERISSDELTLNFKMTRVLSRELGSGSGGAVQVEQTIEIKRRGKRLRIVVDTFQQGQLVGAKEIILVRM